MPNTIVTFNNIEKRYGESTILNIERFSLIAGTCVLIIGDNGAGKTTLLKILAGLMKPDYATVCFGDLERSWKNAKNSLIENVVYLHQRPYMLDSSVFKNVAYGLNANKIAKEKIKTLVTEALHWGSLDHLMHRNAKLLSGGEQQRVALTRARIVQPRALLLDEPTANMDAQSRLQTYHLIDRLRGEGTCVLVATHDTEYIAQLCDLSYRINAGHLVETNIDQQSRPMTNTVTPFPKSAKSRG